LQIILQQFPKFEKIEIDSKIILQNRDTTEYLFLLIRHIEIEKGLKILYFP